jgi:predicted anti-sigma-YlaC factor YlaD
MLTCRDLVQNLASDYLDVQLTWRQRAAVRFHLLICNHCRRFIRQLRLVRSLLARRSEPQPEESEVREIAERLYRRQQGSSGHPKNS